MFAVNDDRLCDAAIYAVMQQGAQRHRQPAAPQVLRQGVGRVGFANAELNGHQQFYVASLEGKRAVEQLFARS